MIRSNREVFSDHKLFRNLRNQNLDHFFDNVSPLEKQPKLNLHPFFESFMENINRKIKTVELKLSSFESQVERLRAILMSKKKDKIFSFANSPESKLQMSPPTTADKAREKLDFGSSTSPRTKEKQLNNSIERKAENEMEKEVALLKIEIKELRNHLSRVHPNPIYNQIIENSSLTLTESKQISSSYENPQIPRIKKVIQISNDEQIERYKTIIAQYQKQEEVLRLMASKSSKYKKGLEEILSFIIEWRDKEVPTYLPCECCQMKEIIFEYFENVENKGLVAHEDEIRDRNSVDSIGNKDSYIEDDFPSGEDSLLMEYDRNEEDSNSD